MDGTNAGRVWAAVLACTAANAIAIWSFAASVHQPAAGELVPVASEWPTYGHDAGGMRFSPLNQIRPANVGQLRPAWIYHMKPPVSAGSAPGGNGDNPPPQGRGFFGGGRPGFAAGETTPLVVNGVMYVSTPHRPVVAPDPTSGTQGWTLKLPSGNPSTPRLEAFPRDPPTPPHVRLR